MASYCFLREGVKWEGGEGGKEGGVWKESEDEGLEGEEQAGHSVELCLITFFTCSYTYSLTRVLGFNSWYLGEKRYKLFKNTNKNDHSY